MPKKNLRDKTKAWTRGDSVLLRALAISNTPTRLISQKLGKSEDVVRKKAYQLGLTLRHQ